MIALLVDAFSVLVTPRGERVAGASALNVLIASAGWAVVVGVAGALITHVLAASGELARRRVGWPRALTVLPLAAPLTVVAWLAFDGLLSGPGARQKSWIGEVRAAAAVASLLGPCLAAWLVVTVLARLPEQSARRQRVLLALLSIAGLGLVVVIAWLDRNQHPWRYADAHVLMWVSLLAGSLVVGALSGRVLRLPEWPAALVLALAAIAAPGLSEPLADDPEGRAAAFRDSLFLRRALEELAPVPEEEPLTIDPELRERLAGGAPIDPALLDRAFPGRRDMNVLLISIDAVRADRLGRARYRRDLTPNIDALVRRGTYFREAWTNYPATRLAFASLMRGRYPSATDVYHDLVLPGTVEDRQPTLADLLGGSGWTTEAVTGFSRFMTTEWFPSVRHGFERFDADQGDLPVSHTLNAERVTDLALVALDRAPEARFFVWAHYFDPHAPYDPVQGNEFGDANVDRYDAEVAYVDRHVGRLLDGLAQRRHVNDTVVILLSDHGEEFGENGRYHHADRVSRLQLHVPLVICIPGAEGREIATPVDLTDVTPTILDLVGIAPPPMQGQSLLPFVLKGDPGAGGEANFPPPIAFAELDEPEMGALGRQYAAREGRWKIIYEVGSRAFFLHDVEKDPLERHNLAREQPEQLARMRSVLDSLRSLTVRDVREDLYREDALLEALASSQVTKRIWALRTLVGRGRPASRKVLDAVTPLVEDAPQVRRLAIRLLAGRDDMMVALKGLEDHPEVLVARARRGEDVRARLGASGPGEAYSRTARLRALAELADADALSRLVFLLAAGAYDDPDPTGTLAVLTKNGRSMPKLDPSAPLDAEAVCEVPALTAKPGDSVYVPVTMASRGRAALAAEWVVGEQRTRLRRFNLAAGLFTPGEPVPGAVVVHLPRSLPPEGRLELRVLID